MICNNKRKVVIMKKKLILLLSSMLIITISSVLITFLVNKEEENQESYTIVTSFYPMYVLAKNIIGDVEGINLVNLTDYQSGCLHDYQLTTADMKRLENADLFIMNGGGMENFIEEIVESYPELQVINASEGIQFLASEHDHDHDHDHDHEEDIHSEEVDSDGHAPEGHAHEEEFNAHVWLNMDYYRIQIENVKNGLIEYNQGHSDKFIYNAKEYDNKIVELKNKFQTTLGDISGNEVVIFHDAFAYLAEQLGLEVVYTINMDNETSLSAGEIALVVDEVKEHDIKVLFTEEQYSTNIAENIANETNAKVHVIDSIVQGSFDEDGYIDAMNYNLEVLKAAFTGK
jgi:zinc transport system substrate-binding protein